MTVKEVLDQLKAMGDAARRAHEVKAGAPENQFGVKLGDLRTIVRERSSWTTRWRSRPGTPGTGETRGKG
jgi:hypothetical protein